MTLSATLIINILAVVGVCIFWLMTFFIFYHLARFGIGLFPKRLSAIFLVGSVVFFAISIIFYARVDFSFLNHLTI